MNENINSPSKLTQFAPLSPDENQPGVASILSKFFKFTRSSQNVNEPVTSPNNDDQSACSLDSESWRQSGSTRQTPEEDTSSMMNFPLDTHEERNLPNVLNRISSILAMKSNNLQSYNDSQLRSYWMPDNVSKECYECCEKFTTFRRRHHCRVCGQIFCAKCCSDHIPGKIMGCTGDLRVCTYCCKIVLSYLQSSDMRSDLSADLKALQEDLQVKYGNDIPAKHHKNVNTSTSTEQAIGRKQSVGYMEENYAIGRSGNNYLTSKERCLALQNSASLRMIYEELFRSSQAILIQTHRVRLKSYYDCFLASELVNWMIAQNKAATRVQATAIGQALLEAGFIESVCSDDTFTDNTSIFKPAKLSTVHNSNFSCDDEGTGDAQEPAWVKTIPQHDSTTDSESETKSPRQILLDRFPSSSSSYYLDLDLEASTVTLKRPKCENSSISVISDSFIEHREIHSRESGSIKVSEDLLNDTLQVQEIEKRNGWHKTSNLGCAFNEISTYHCLTGSLITPYSLLIFPKYKDTKDTIRKVFQIHVSQNGFPLINLTLRTAYVSHEDSIMKQLLDKEGLSQKWSEVIVPLIDQIIDNVRPNLNHDADILDIRHYVQIKKCPGGSKEDCQITSGVICSKNVAHRQMNAMIANPKILLLQCGLMYQRVEGKLLSLEPVMLQENEYLGHTVNRITSLGPDIVLIHRSVSRLAQDRLRESGVTLVLNVKLSVLERVARCTGASIVNTVDAHIGTRHILGTCKKFYLRNFFCEQNQMKTLMYFEGCPNSHLCSTILLRGGSRSELKKVKKVTSTMIFAAYSNRLEKSFLMDEFAEPPSSTDNSFFDCDESSESRAESIPEDSTVSREKTIVDEKRMYGEFISDRSDPLHQYLNEDDDQAFDQTEEHLSVTNLPLSNKFKKALGDTILSLSPYIKFTMPYLETEQGRNCILRSFFPRDIYYSDQFLDLVQDGSTRGGNNLSDPLLLPSTNQTKSADRHHPLILAKLTTDAESNEVQRLLADFRACGGPSFSKTSVLIDKQQRVSIPEHSLPIDCLDPNNHQRLCVLFCSFLHTGTDTPAFCVNPSEITMNFYGTNDIALGRYLKHYCLTTEYKCRAKGCRARIAHHVRRFAHDGGCVYISLNEMKNEPFGQENQDKILMWSKCLKCKVVSPVVPMSDDTWSLSFAKYLELRFHANIYTSRVTENCQHSLHHEHNQYFAGKNMLAEFKYRKISLWEICLPPPLINIIYDPKYHGNVIEEMKSIALKGDDVFSNIKDKLIGLQLQIEPDSFNSMKQQLNKEQLYFKSKIEECQLKLTSPTLENKKLQGKGSEKQVQALIFRIEDGIVILKRLISEAVCNWNGKLSGITIKKKDTEKPLRKFVERPSILDGDGYITEDTASESQIEDSSPISADFNAVDALKLHTPEPTENSDNEFIDSNNLTDVVVVDRRSISDLTLEDAYEKKKKRKTILSQLLPSISVTPHVLNPLNPIEHHLLPLGSVVPMVVYENEPSSIIAYALDSHDYKHALQDSLRTIKGPETNASPLNKRKFPENKENIPETVSNQSGGELKSSVLSFFRGTAPSPISPVMESEKTLCPGDSNNPSNTNPTSETEEDKKTIKQQNYIEVQFNDATSNFFCRIYFAAQFAAFRENVLPCGEEGFTRSISRSVQWAAKGGKSGSAFCKSRDDRFILKEMSRLEMQIFLDFAPNYFGYMENCQQRKQPTLLGKIVGVYRVSFKNNVTNAALRTSLLVMENLFYDRTITDKFDLKGSVRNRLVNPDDFGQEGDLVLLDENLLNMSCDSPLYIRSHSKAILNRAIEQDTKFLADNSVMDYSLLVGLEPYSDQLVLGIIDYIRTFTWDKKLETMVKKSGILGGQGKLPTIVSPQEYRTRFKAAMDRYFLPVPDRWFNLGKDTETS